MGTQQDGRLSPTGVNPAAKTAGVSDSFDAALQRMKKQFAAQAEDKPGGAEELLTESSGFQDESMPKLASSEPAAASPASTQVRTHSLVLVVF